MIVLLNRPDNSHCKALGNWRVDLDTRKTELSDWGKNSVVGKTRKWKKAMALIRLKEEHRKSQETHRKSAGNTQDSHRKHKGGQQGVFEGSQEAQRKSTGSTQEDHRKRTWSPSKAHMRSTGIQSSLQDVHRRPIGSTQKVHRKYTGRRNSPLPLPSCILSSPPVANSYKVRYGLHRPCPGTTKPLTRVSDNAKSVSQEQGIFLG